MAGLGSPFFLAMQAAVAANKILFIIIIGWQVSEQVKHVFILLLFAIREVGGSVWMELAGLIGCN